MTNIKDMSDNNTIGIDYTDQQLRVLVEEYIIQQCSTFTLHGVCNYVLYWAMEDQHTTNKGLYDGNQLAPADCQRVRHLLDQIAKEDRLVADGDMYTKVME